MAVVCESFSWKLIARDGATTNGNDVFPNDGARRTAHRFLLSSANANEGVVINGDRLPWVTYQAIIEWGTRNPDIDYWIPEGHRLTTIRRTRIYINSFGQEIGRDSCFIVGSKHEGDT
jgi:hypothetical protein